MADRKSRQMMHRAKKKNPDGIIVAVGCYVQAAKEQLEEDTLIDPVSYTHLIHRRRHAVIDDRAAIDRIAGYCQGILPCFACR